MTCAARPTPPPLPLRRRWVLEHQLDALAAITYQADPKNEGEELDFTAVLPSDWRRRRWALEGVRIIAPTASPNGKMVYDLEVWARSELLGAGGAGTERWVEGPTWMAPLPREWDGRLQYHYRTATQAKYATAWSLVEVTEEEACWGG